MREGGRGRVEEEEKREGGRRGREVGEAVYKYTVLLTFALSVSGVS